MQIFKFGGASVKDADGIRNLASILSDNRNNRLFVVISAMAKTTNNLEAVHAAYYSGNQTEALSLLEQIKSYHYQVIAHLYGYQHHSDKVESVFQKIEQIVNSVIDTDFDRSYDAIVSNGEILSTLIISEYLEHIGLHNRWLNMPQILITDNTFREANIQFDSTRNNLLSAIEDSSIQIFIAQGFIGGTQGGNPTTLGREGSDYTAAIVANLIDAESVTIWKDVPGIMNADPKLFSNAIHIPELTYYDAVELTYSGAQVIHPKSIRPLENKTIPLYVRPFATPKEKGSIISNKVSRPISVPVYILRKNQVLITVRPLDFSFVLEESLSKIFSIIEHNRLKVSLIQSSAVTISVCVDNSRYLADAISELQSSYKVTYNDGLSLLTIRGTTSEIIADAEKDKDILLKQTTRRTIKLVYR